MYRKKFGYFFSRLNVAHIFFFRFPSVPCENFNFYAVTLSTFIFVISLGYLFPVGQYCSVLALLPIFFYILLNWHR